MTNDRYTVGTRVTTNDTLESNEQRGYNFDALRIPAARGVIVKVHDSHGLCYAVDHGLGETGFYDHDELTPAPPATQEA